VEPRAQVHEERVLGNRVECGLKIHIIQAAALVLHEVSVEDGLRPFQVFAERSRLEDGAFWPAAHRVVSQYQVMKAIRTHLGTQAEFKVAVQNPQR
jgi:hypothetical protein